LEADVLVIALEIPWGGGDGMIARLNDGLTVRRKPLILVIGDVPADTLSVRTGVAPCNCFSKPLRKEDLLDRIGMESAIGLLRGAEDWQRSSEKGMRRTLMEEGNQAEDAVRELQKDGFDMTKLSIVGKDCLVPVELHSCSERILARCNPPPPLGHAHRLADMTW
jgi:hypothetical protein